MNFLPIRGHRSKKQQSLFYSLAYAEGLEARQLLSTYDAAAGFSPAANPNGVWSYGETQSLGSAFTLYTNSYNSAAGEARWSAAGSFSPPWVSENLTGTSITDGTHIA